MVDQFGPVPDYLECDMKIVFIGFNPSLRSGETGHHFANPNNRFWRILFDAGITPTLYRPQDDHKLPQLGYGLTNIVPRPTRAASDILPEEYALGRLILLKKLKFYRPRIACYVGKGVYQALLEKKQAPWGYQSINIIDGVRDFVAPSSSGLVRMRTKEIAVIYHLLIAKPSVT